MVTSSMLDFFFEPALPRNMQHLPSNKLDLKPSTELARWRF